MARLHRLFVSALGLTFATAACGGKRVQETPEPASTPVSAPAPTPTATATPVTVERLDAASTDAHRMTLEQRIHFALDRADLSPEAQAILVAKVEILRASPEVSLRIEGHADERGSDEYNLALSQRRAAAAKRFLMNRGIEAGRLETVGYGEERPLDPSSTEAAWALNRRADFQISGGAISQR